VKSEGIVVEEGVRIRNKEIRSVKRREQGY
jgi:hypothetical protein